jgi:hypothetical protein
MRRIDYKTIYDDYNDYDRYYGSSYSWSCIYCMIT